MSTLTDEDSQLARIQDKLLAARARDRHCVRFGARRHAYRLGPVLPLESVVALERASGVDLPRDFRRFVCEVGDGGAGPAYGWQASSSSAASHATELRRPFDPAEGEEAGGCIALYEHGCGIYELLVVTGPERGSMWLSDDHCDLFPLPGRDWNALEGLTGPNASTAWRARLADPANRSRISFLDHYEQWLDEVLADPALPGAER